MESLPPFLLHIYITYIRVPADHEADSPSRLATTGPGVQLQGLPASAVPIVV